MSLELKIVVQDDGTATIKKFKDTTVQSMNDVSRATDKASESGKGQIRTLGELTSKVKDIRAAYLGYAAAATAVVAVVSKVASGMMSLATQTAEYRDSMKDMSTATGISIGNLAGLKYAAEEAGSSFEGMVTGVRVLYRTMYDATTGLKEAEDKFKRLGISVTDSNGNLRDGMQVMMEVADKMKGMTNATERAATAQEIFGRSGMELVPVLSEGSSAIKEAITQAEKLGLTFSTTEGIMADKFNTTMNDLKRSISGLKMQFGEELIGPLTTLASSLTVIISQVREFIDSAGGFSNAIDMMIPVWLRAPQGKPGASSKDLFEMSAMLDEAMKGKPSPGPVSGGGTGISAVDSQKVVDEALKAEKDFLDEINSYREEKRKEAIKKGDEEYNARRKQIEDSLKLEQDAAEDSKEIFEKYLEDKRKMNKDAAEQSLVFEEEMMQAQYEKDQAYAQAKIELQQVMQDTLYNLQIAFAGKSKEGMAIVKALAFAETMISAITSAQKAYEAVIKAAAFIPGLGVLALPMAAAAGASAMAAGVARAEKINSMSFASGGVLVSGPRAFGTNEVLYQGTPGEGVVSRRGMDAIGAEGLDAINRGRRYNRNISVNVNARTFDEDFVRKNLMPMIRRMEKRERA